VCIHRHLGQAVRSLAVRFLARFKNRIQVVAGASIKGRSSLRLLRLCPIPAQSRFLSDSCLRVCLAGSRLTITALCNIARLDLLWAAGPRASDTMARFRTYEGVGKRCVRVFSLIRSLTYDPPNLVQRVLRTAPRPESMGTLKRVLLIDRIEQLNRSLLQNLRTAHRKNKQNRLDATSLPKAGSL